MIEEKVTNKKKGCDCTKCVHGFIPVEDAILVECQIYENNRVFPEDIRGGYINCEHYKEGENNINKEKYNSQVELYLYNKEHKEENKEQSEINHPSRYGGDTTYECIKVLEQWMTDEQYIGFLRGNALKYLCRLGKKDECIKELEKAKWYIDKMIEKMK